MVCEVQELLIGVSPVDDEHLLVIVIFVVWLVVVVSERLGVIEQKVDYNVVSGDVNVLEYFTIHLLINLINFKHRRKPSWAASVLQNLEKAFIFATSELQNRGSSFVGKAAVADTMISISSIEH